MNDVGSKWRQSIKEYLLAWALVIAEVEEIIPQKLKDKKKITDYFHCLEHWKEDECTIAKDTHQNFNIVTIKDLLPVHRVRVTYVMQVCAID